MEEYVPLTLIEEYVIIESVKEKTPQQGEGCFIAPSADVIGDVVVGAHSSIWHRCVLRGDVMPIRIGEMSNVQDGSILHGSFGAHGVTVGSRVSVGHGVILHGCCIHNECLIGMGSILMDGCEVGELSLVGAGSLLTENSKFEGGQLILGRPAKVMRPLTEKEKAVVSGRADEYKVYMGWYQGRDEEVVNSGGLHG